MTEKERSEASLTGSFGGPALYTMGSVMMVAWTRSS